MMKSGVYTTGDEQLSGWPEKVLQSTSQGQICTKKRSWSLFGGLLPVWSTIAFWTQWNHYIWAVCSAGQWGAPKTAAVAACTGQQSGLRSSHDNAQPHVAQPALQKLNESSYSIFLIRHIHLTSHKLMTTSLACRSIASVSDYLHRVFSFCVSNFMQYSFLCVGVQISVFL